MIPVDAVNSRGFPPQHALTLSPVFKTIDCPYNEEKTVQYVKHVKHCYTDNSHAVARVFAR